MNVDPVDDSTLWYVNGYSRKTSQVGWRARIASFKMPMPEIQTAAPKAYENRVRRAGTLNAFDDPAFVEAVSALNRPNLVIAGLLTDVCLFHSVVSAVAAGYRVVVVADASGTSTELADAVTYDRLRAAGAEVASTYGVLFELYSDLSTEEGQRAEAVAAGSVAA